MDYSSWSVPMLILDRRFAPLALAQFLTGLNSNFLKNALVFLVLANLPGIAGESAVALYSALFMIPMIFMSGLGGQLADRYDRSVLARNLKAGELVAVGVAMAGIVMSSHLLVLCGVAGVQIVGSLFAPVRSSLIPLSLPREIVPAANAWIEGCSFAAMILGLWLVGAAFAVEGMARWMVSGTVLVLAASCFVAVNFVPKVEVTTSRDRVDYNLLASTHKVVRSLAADRRLAYASGMLGWSWFVAALVLSTAAALLVRMEASTQIISYCMIAFGVSGVIGSSVAAKLDLPRPYALCVGFAGMAAGAAAMSCAHPEYSVVGFAIAMAACSFSHGFVLVTCNTDLQTLAPTESKGRVAGGANVVNSVFMVAGGMGTAALVAGGVDLALVYAFAAFGCTALCLVATAGIRRLRRATGMKSA